MKGRKAKPQRLRVLSGDPQGKGRRVPQPSAGAVRCPSWLSKVARARWRELAPELKRLGLLTVLDAGLLAAYCETYATWRDAIDVLRKEGLTYQTPAGLTKRHPAGAMADQAAKNLRLIGDEFGLSPLARQRLDVDPVNDEADELADFIGGGDARQPDPK